MTCKGLWKACIAAKGGGQAGTRVEPSLDRADRTKGGLLLLLLGNATCASRQTHLL